MSSVDIVATYILNHAETISKEIVTYNVNKIEITLPNELIERSIAINSEFLKFLGKTLISPDEIVADEFIPWYRKYLEQENTPMTNISSLIKPYAETRQQLINMITKISIEHGLSTEDVVNIISRISYLLDLSITETIVSREQAAEEINNNNQKVITELSSPVVPIQNGMAILPLIGEMDLDRSEHIMNSVIPKISQMKIKCLIIDFSGMASVDTEMASRIFNIYDILRLLGINAMFTGIRPDLATKIIGAGIDFSSLNTFATVQQAILNNEC